MATSSSSSLFFDGGGDGDGDGEGSTSQREEELLHFDSLAASDFQLAYRLQLEEALAASAAGAPSSLLAKEEGFPSADLSRMFASAMATEDPSSSSSALVVMEDGFPPVRHHSGVLLPSSICVSAMAGGDPPPPPPPHSSSLVAAENQSLGIPLQSLELSQLQQEAADPACTASEAEQNRATLLQVSHGTDLTHCICNSPNHQKWDECGDLLKDADKRSLESTDSPHLPPPIQLYFTTIHLNKNTDNPSSSSSVLSPSPITSFMGMAILDHTGHSLVEIKKPLGTSSCKDESDYLALIFTLEQTLSAGFRFIQAYTDSVVVFNQMKGRWKVNNKKELSLWFQVMLYIHEFQGFELLLLTKNENQHATRLAREAIDSELSATRQNAPPSSHDDIRSVNEVLLEDCTICLEERAESEMVMVTPCSHRFCMSCVVQYIEVKVQAGRVPVQCPHLDCKCSFSLEQCKAALSQKWFDLLMRMLTEASIPERERVYCPFPQCSALMLKNDFERTLQASSSSSSSLWNSYVYNRVTCVECHRPFCHYCRVPWHEGISCAEYRKSPLNGQNTQDAYLYDLARGKKWQRCKKCKHMIELAEGCYHITCRCGHEFCYICGTEWVDKKKTCKCILWDARNVHFIPRFDLFNSNFFDDDDDRKHQAFDCKQAATNPLYKTKLCMYHRRGYCWLGRNCKFAHGEHELREIDGFQRNSIKSDHR